MDANELKTIAAFGGFGLGIINLGITVFKEFFRKSQLSISIEKCEVKCQNEGEFWLQVDLCMMAKHGDLSIKSIKLIHPQRLIGEYDSTNKIRFNKAIKNQNYNLLSLDDFPNKIKDLFEDAISVRDAKIEKDGMKSYTFATVIYTRRDMDGHEDFPLQDWILEIDIGHKIIRSSIEKLQISKSSKDGYWLRRGLYDNSHMA